MNKKAQSGVVLAIFLFITAGVVLWALNPFIVDVKNAQLAVVPAGDVLETLFLTALVPIIWLVYIIFGAVFILASTRGQG